MKPETGSRRGFLRFLSGGFLSLWGIGAAGLVLSFLKAPGSEKRPSEGSVDCGPLSTLETGDARIVRHGNEPLIVIRHAEDHVQAFSGVCTHMRCILKWDSQSKTILCPCHEGSFDRSGNVLTGPPPRPLRRYAAEIRGDKIVARLNYTDPVD